MWIDPCGRVAASADGSLRMITRELQFGRLRQLGDRMAWPAAGRDRGGSRQDQALALAAGRTPSPDKARRWQGDNLHRRCQPVVGDTDPDIAKRRQAVLIGISPYTRRRLIDVLIDTIRRSAPSPRTPPLIFTDYPATCTFHTRWRIDEFVVSDAFGR